MELDPLNIFMALLRIAPVVITIVILVALFFLFKTEIRTDDIERASIEISENLFSSELTADKYVLNTIKLDDYDQSNSERKTELEFLRSCSYAYFITIENLKTKKQWSFGYRPPQRGFFNDPNMITVIHDSSDTSQGGYVILSTPERTFLAAIQITNQNRQSNYYETIDQAEVTIKLYDTWLTRSTCLVEKAFTLKEVQEMQIPCITLSDTFSPCGFSLQRHPNFEFLACSFQRNSAGIGNERDCRYFPSEVKFEKIDVTFEKTTKGEKRKIVAYPIKEGFSIPNCDDVKSGEAIADKSDNVQTVLLCAEDVKKK